MWKKFVREYLSFTRRQRRGLYVLGSIILSCLLFSYLLSVYQSKKRENHTEFNLAVRAFLKKQKEKEAPPTIHLSRFDPNKISTKKWLELGVTRHTAMTIQHYLAAGGHFTEKGDLKNIYGLSDSMYRKLQPYVYISKSDKHKPSRFNRHKIRLHPFNPNDLSVSGWVDLGISAHTAHTIRNYIAAGGHFYQKEDLKKIYGLSKQDYRRLAPYVKIAEKETERIESVVPVNESPSKNNDINKHSRHFFVDINTADSAAWCELYGIGPAFSSRIVHFRKALGGFYQIDQLAEVYGLPDSTFQHIKPYLRLSEKNVRQLNVNRATVKELKTHPYISYSLADALVAYRQQHGSFDSIPEIKNIQLIDPDLYRKLVPYLTVQ